MSDDESRFTKKNRAPKEIVKLNGDAITVDGAKSKSRYFDFLNINLDGYSDLEFSPDQALKVANHLRKLSTGATAMTPMYCGGAQCPFSDRCPLHAIGKAPIGRQCHPKGELILTSKHGYIPIEELDPDIHTLVSWERKSNIVRRGRNKIGSKFRIANEFRIDDNLTTFTLASEDKYTCTHDHICVAKFNENAIGKFVVYLMRKGNAWRVGKSKLISECVDNDYQHKTYLNFPMRGNREQADDMWILGVYNTNAEALLQEDYFSIYLQVSKACFTHSQDQKIVKWNGLYKWVSQEQLDKYHSKCSQQLDRDIEGKLRKMGLSPDYPIWSRNQYSEDDTGFKLYVRWPMYIRACNVLPEVMDMLVVQDYSNKAMRSEIVSIEKKLFEGQVYSLEVLPHETYIVNNVVTHNCLIEVELMKEFIMRTVDEYDIDPANFTEIGFANELAEIEILLMRLNMNIAKAENAELVIDQTVGIGQDGTPLIQKQLSPFMEQKEKLYARRAKVIKLMVGDRQEKYKQEAALKVKLDADPSSRMSAMRAKLENLTRQLDEVGEKAGEISKQEGFLSPQDLIDEED